jgi:putative transposase
MGRPRRVDLGGYVYHVLNRGNARMAIFEKDDDYKAFEGVLEEAVDRFGVRLVAYCLMPNHWHLVLWPRRDGDLSAFMGWLTLTHTQRWHAHRRSTGAGHVYQGRYKSFLVEGESYLVAVCRYVERNARRAGLVRRAEHWRWSSLWRWLKGDNEAKALLSAWPTPSGRRPPRWVEQVNQPQSAAELQDIRRSVNRAGPYGSEPWRQRMVKTHGLTITQRPRGRPRKR